MSFGQRAASPYSAIGIGKINENALIYNQNMGGLGLSHGTPWILNWVNPALLAKNSFTSFEAAFTYENNDVRTSSINENFRSGFANYILLGFPIKTGKMGMMIGLAPYSSVNYDIFTIDSLESAQRNLVYNYTGNGGAAQLFMAAGYTPFKNFYVGGKVTYLFSTIERLSVINWIPEPGESFLPSVYSLKTRFSDFKFNGSAAYEWRVNDKNSINFGVTYDFAADINAFSTEELQLRFQQDIGENVSDTVVLQGETKNRMKFPSKFGAGVSYSRGYKWMIGMDFYSEQFSAFRNENGENNSYGDSYKMIIGGKFVPDPTSVTSYLKRVTYQLGGYYSQTPYLINGATVDDFGINFGVSLPVGAVSTANLGFNWGKMGTTENGSIQEDYYKISLSIGFNDQSFGWYRKQRKFN
ncbi:MAG TPA: hypothetical protein DDY13_00010 [Cytophagales bacterium]|nr:hypothetical protein [Cytophagales bacterium]